MQLAKSNNSVANSPPNNGNVSEQFTDEFRKLSDKFLQEGLDFEEAKKITQQIFDGIERDKFAPDSIFAECNYFQINEISFLLEKELQIAVKPMLVEELSQKLPNLIIEGKKINVITTGFHVNEVRNSVGELPINIDVLITNLNPDTRRELEKVGEKGKFCFICRDHESAVLYNELLKAELGFKEMSLTCCTLSESERLEALINSSDVILASPPVYEEVKKLTPRGKTVYNVFERVDPMSLKVIKDRIIGNPK